MLPRRLTDRFSFFRFLSLLATFGLLAAACTGSEESVGDSESPAATDDGSTPDVDGADAGSADADSAEADAEDDGEADGADADEGDAGDTATDEAGSAESEDVTGGVIDWSACGGGECGTLTVPINHDDPSAGTIDLALARVPATGAESERIGSLFVNFGGPGGDGTSNIMSFAPFFPDEVQARFDIVSFDPRGVEESAGLGCDDEIGDEPVVLIDAGDGFADDVAEGVADWERLMACVAESPIVDDLGTIAVARDLDLMRAAVGDEQLTFLGFSYGTQLGWVYATLFPENTRALLLDGAVPPGSWNDEGWIEQSQGIADAIQRLDQGCAEASDCALDGEGLLATLERLAAELEADPIPIDNGETYGPVDLINSTVQTTYVNPQLVGPLFSQAIAALDEGDVGAVLNYDSFFEGGFEEGLFLSAICADGGGSVDDEAIAVAFETIYEISPFFGAAPGATYCDRFPGEIDGLPTLDTTGAAPILVVGSTGDNATPYASAVELDSLLADSVLLSFDGPGHTIVTADPCIDAFAEAYLIDLELPPEGTRCGDPTGGAPDDWIVPIPEDGSSPTN